MENQEHSEITKRIKEIINYLGLSESKFAQEIGVTQSGINSMFRRNTEPSFKILNAIVVKYTFISSEWLLHGEGEMLKQDTPYMEQPLEADSRNQFDNVKEALMQKELDGMKLQMDRDQKLMSQLLNVIDNNTIIIKNLSEEITALKTMMKTILNRKQMDKDSMSYWANEVSMGTDGFEEV